MIQKLSFDFYLIFMMTNRQTDEYNISKKYIFFLELIHTLYYVDIVEVNRREIDLKKIINKSGWGEILHDKKNKEKCQTDTNYNIN